MALVGKAGAYRFYTSTPGFTLTATVSWIPGQARDEGGIDLMFPNSVIPRWSRSDHPGDLS